MSAARRPLPRRDGATEYERDLISAIEDRLAALDRQSRTIASHYPVGTVHLTENPQVPDALLILGSWSTPVEAAALGAPLGLYAFKRTG